MRVLVFVRRMFEVGRKENGGGSNWIENSNWGNYSIPVQYCQYSIVTAGRPGRSRE